MMQNPIWFLFWSGQILLRAEATGLEALPCAPEAPLAPAGGVHDLGGYAQKPCRACRVDFLPEEGGLRAVDLRSAYRILGESLYQLAGKGREMIHWEEHSRYCPACGAGTEPATPLSRQCPACGRLLFPHIAPAVLALIHKEDRILLVRAHSFTGPHYGLVAGFLEPGESLEECVRREVLEETGLEVGGITYFGSQPWPYPSGLMVGFVMRHTAGEIRLQQEELSHGAFFPRQDLPGLPHRLSLARRMIDSWLAGLLS
ncbi:MAG: NAD(+) diphosphatase [Desulfovibrio sp.]|jgi:NAD+ diphosphatase|nr:NAD(+) diphosphatase [Desulfovibrio sp.]